MQAKSKPDPKEPEESLASQFERSCQVTLTLANMLIDQRVRYLKLCHPSLPEESLRMGIEKMRDCSCAIAREVSLTNEGQ
jgi:hypothetical protein